MGLRVRAGGKAVLIFSPGERSLDVILIFRNNCIFPSHVRFSHHSLCILFSSRGILSEIRSMTSPSLSWLETPSHLPNLQLSLLTEHRKLRQHCRSGIQAISYVKA